MGAASDKITALKSAFDAAIARVQAKLDASAMTDADLTTIDDMTTAATNLAADTGPPAPPPPPPPPPTP
jgi:hypothetical protein